MTSYWIEAVVVGLATLVVGTFLSVCAMYTQKEFAIGDIDFWPSLLLTTFLTGFAVHLLCEWSGLNQWYCRQGHACTR